MDPTIVIAAPTSGSTSSAAAVVQGRRIKLEAGTVLLIEKGETHEVRNTGTTPLKTVNFYLPPAYNSDGDELPRGKS